MTQNTATLNQRFGINGKLHFREKSENFIVADITNEYGAVTIALQGAHVLSWRPTQEHPVIWLSSQAVLAEGKSIRGGIPICWPWFGAHGENTTYPAHGFARTRVWEVVDAAHLGDAGSRLVLRLTTQGGEAMWPHTTTVELTVHLGKTLNMALTTTNHSDKCIEISQALHTYFAVGDIGRVAVHGLDKRPYLNKLEGFKRQQQQGAIRFNGEVDRVYLETSDPCLIDDASMSRTLCVEKTGSASTVVWNPWQTRADEMGDMGEDGYRRMVCVETANAADDAVTLMPGESHTLSVSYAVKDACRNH